MSLSKRFPPHQGAAVRFKNRAVWAAAAGWILAGLFWFAPKVCLAGSLIDGIPAEAAPPFKLNLDFVGGWPLWNNPDGGDYRLEDKLGGEFSIPGTDLSWGPLLALHQVKTLDQLGLGIRLDLLSRLKMSAQGDFSDTGTRFVLDLTHWPIDNFNDFFSQRNTAELGGLLDVGGLVRFGA